jgi:hypothetical protein
MPVPSTRTSARLWLAGWLWGAAWLPVCGLGARRFIVRGSKYHFANINFQRVLQT